LCAIVRDEIINPAGGIVDFVDSTMPYMEAGVIVDTGSIDGTCDALEELVSKYPNLQIFDRKFDGFAPSRNYSLKKVKTKQALVLDADERLTRQDFEQLKLIMEANPAKGFNFMFLNVYPDYEKIGIGVNPRLFEVSNKTRYRNRVYEHLYFNGFSTDIKIKHFFAYWDPSGKKYYEFYKKLQRKFPLLPWSLFRDVQPSSLLSFNEWKAYNPRREMYR